MVEQVDEISTVLSVANVVLMKEVSVLTRGRVYEVDGSTIMRDVQL